MCCEIRITTRERELPGARPQAAARAPILRAEAPPPPRPPLAGLPSARINHYSSLVWPFALFAAVYASHVTAATTAAKTTVCT